MVPALLKWIGNKQRVAGTIVSHMPDAFHHYYEPFLGSGAVMAELLAREAGGGAPAFQHAFGSDVLPFLIGIFDLAKHRPEALIAYYDREITAYYDDPDGRYEVIRDRFNRDHNPLDFCLLSRTCYSGVIRFRKADGYMSTPRGPHSPIRPAVFRRRVQLWSALIQRADFRTEHFERALLRPGRGDVVYCDPPYTHSQSILYGAQSFQIERLWSAIDACKRRGAYVMLSINGTRESKKKNISASIPAGLFRREFVIDCGVSMIDRLQNSGGEMSEELVHDKLLLTW